MGLDITVRKLGRKIDFAGIKTKYDTTVDDCYFSLTRTNDDGSITYDDSGFPEWAVALSESRKESYYDWDKYKENTGIDIVNDYEWCMAGPLNSWDDDENIIYGFVFKNKNTHERISIPFDDIPTIEKDIQVVYYNPIDVGYMRKGLNGDFYDDYDKGICNYFVFDKNELLRILEAYVIDERKEYFKNNLIDRFVEGEMVVTFDW